jgi:Mg2+ and Co2+ transporter CorA
MAFSAFMEMLRRVPQHVREYPQHSVMFVHHILDVIVDSFRSIIQSLQKRSDELELSVLEGKQRRLLRLNILRRDQQGMAEMRQILFNRQSLVILRRTLASELAIVNHFIKEFDFEGASEESEEIAIYFRDVADHVKKYLEIIEEEQHNYDHIMEMHVLVTSHRTNQIIYVLTIISAIMLPLNLIVGFWGMNFDNLFFTHSDWGIWLVTLMLVGFTALLLSLFRYKGWV